MPLQCVVRMAHGVKQLVDVYFAEPVSSGCSSIEFAVAGQFVKLANECGLQLRLLARALNRPVWYDYHQRTVGVVPPISNGVLFSEHTDTIMLGDTQCRLDIALSKHLVPPSLSTLWVRIEDADNQRTWEGLLDENDATVGDECVLSLYALRGSPGVSSTGDVLMILPQTEMQGMLALVCAAIAAVYLVGSASFYDYGGTVGEVHGNSKSTKLFLVDGPLTAFTAVVAALMIGAPENQMSWVQYQRAVLCGSTTILFIMAAYLLYADTNSDVRSSTLRTVVELPLLVAVYSPLAASASGVVGLAALLLGVGTVLIAMRAPPVAVADDVYDAIAKFIAIWVQAPALFAGVITNLGDDGVSQAVASVAISLGICAASLHASNLSRQSIRTESE